MTLASVLDGCANYFNSQGKVNSTVLQSPKYFLHSVHLFIA